MVTAREHYFFCARYRTGGKEGLDAMGVQAEKKFRLREKHLVKTIKSGFVAAVRSSREGKREVFSAIAEALVVLQEWNRFRTMFLPSPTPRMESLDNILTTFDCHGERDAMAFRRSLEDWEFVQSRLGRDCLPVRKLDEWLNTQDLLNCDFEKDLEESSQTSDE